MAKTFDAATRDFLRKTQEVDIRTSRMPDRGVTIWVVVVGDDVFVRSVKASKGKWYLTAAAEGKATLEINGRDVPVRVTSVTDPAIIAAVSREYLRKYAASPYAQPMVRDETLATTLQLEPA